MTRKGQTSVFSAVEEFEADDFRADKKRKTDSKGTLAQSKAARSQIDVHSHLMECRILLQRAKTVCDSLEDSSAAAAGADEQQGNDAAVEACNELLVNLLRARQRMRGKIIVDEAGEDSSNYDSIVRGKDSDRKVEETLRSEYQQCESVWRDVLNRRHFDLTLHAGLANKTKFQVVDATFWDQVEATVSHEELLRPQEEEEGEEEKKKSHVFDDSKVYQQMLKDFLSSGAKDRGTAAEAAAERLRRADKKRKNKEQVDRKASKGRKIRYNVIPKLTNFTFPVSRPSNGSGMDEDEWFRSLFGVASGRS